MWLKALHLMTNGHWAEAQPHLQNAAAKKEGWGWGVNNGDFWIALGAVQIIRWGENITARLTGPLDLGNLTVAESTLQLASDRQPSHPWTQYNLHVLKTLRELANESDFAELLQQLKEFSQETKSWSEQTLVHAQPKPRRAHLPPTPWTDRAHKVKPLAKGFTGPDGLDHGSWSVQHEL